MEDGLKSNEMISKKEEYGTYIESNLERDGDAYPFQPSKGISY